jgi:hypothetical protein
VAKVQHEDVELYIDMFLSTSESFVRARFAIVITKFHVIELPSANSLHECKFTRISRRSVFCFIVQCVFCHYGLYFVKCSSIACDLGTRWPSDCVEGSWRDWNHARKYSDWLELDGGDPSFLILTEKEIAVVIYFILFSSSLHILLYLPFICCLSFLRLSFALLIRVIG